MKLFNYIFLLTGISILLALSGIQVAGFTELFNKIGLDINNNQFNNFKIDSTLWNVIFGTQGLLTAIGSMTLIGVGFFIYTQDKSFLMLPVITGVFFYWMSVLVSISDYARVYGNSLFSTISLLIIVPLTVGFLIACIQWFLGID